MAERSIEQHFVDWESYVFGFGYGSGERPILSALKTFMDTVEKRGEIYQYGSDNLETALTPPVAWLLINTLCHQDMIEYGTSPRCGWLTPYGKALKDFIDSKSADELYALIVKSWEGEHTFHCEPNSCNCGDEGTTETKLCRSPFWFNKGDKRQY